MNPLVERLGWVLVHSLWQFALVALLAGVIVRAMRRSSSAARYGVLVVAMAVSVAAPMATWLISPSDARDELASRGALAPGQESIVAISPGADAARLANNPILANDPEVPTQNHTSSSVVSEPQPAVSPTAPVIIPSEPSWSERAKTILRPWLAWVVVGWSLGVVMCSLRPLLGWHTLRRLQRVGVSPASDEVLSTLRRVSEQLRLRRAVRVLQSTLAQVPVVVGYLRPVILLPVSLMTSLPAAQLEAILAHELAHVRRHDFVVNLLQTLIETFFFYHPAAWWLSHQIRVEREHCCDDLVVASFGNRVEYGRALLAIEELRGRSSVLALGAADGTLLSRIRRILGSGSDHGANERWPAAILTLTVFSLAIAVSMTWSLVANDDPRNATQPAIAKLPDDVTVELVCVTHHRSPSEPESNWWTPSGSPLAEGRIERKRFRGKPASENQRLFVVEVRGLPEVSDVRVAISPAGSMKMGYFGSTGSTSRIVGKSDATNFTTAGPFFDANQTSVRVRVATDDWGPIQEVSTSATRINELKLKPDYANCYGKVGPQLVREVGSNSHFTLTWPRNQDDLCVSEVWAVDKDGKRHEDNGTAGPPNGREFSFPLPLAQIARFEYRLRPVRHLVTFENVALNPGEMTDVTIKVESVPKPKPDRNVAELPKGVRVEFVGLAAMEAEPKTWWKPDGSPLSDVPNSSKELWRVSGQEVRRALIRVHGGGLSYLDVNPGMSCTRLDEAHGSGGPFVLLDGGYTFPPGQKTGRIEVGIATQPQSPVRRLDAKGRRIVQGRGVNSDTGFQGLIVVEEFETKRPIVVDAGDSDRIAENDDITIEKVEQPPQWVKKSTGKELPETAEQKAENDERRVQTQVLWSAPKRWKSFDLEMTLIDIDGKSHSHSGRGANFDTDEMRRRQINRGSVLFNVPLSRVAGFEYRIRRFQHWVTFDNVALNPGEMTDVKVKVESQPARAGRGSPDPALDPTAGLPNSDDETNNTNNANGDLRSNPAAGSGDTRRADEKAQPRVAIQDVVRKVDFSKVKVLGYDEALRQTPDLHVPDPQNPKSWTRPKNVFPMPLGEHTWLKYPAGSGHFYIEHRPDGSPESELLYGPIDGDPFDVLKLDDFFQKKLWRDSQFIGDPGYRLRLMFRTGEPRLTRRAWQYIEPILSRKFLKRNEPDLFARLELLEIARDGLRDEVAKSKRPELVELAKRMQEVIRAAEESVDAINDSVPDASYGSATYLQPKIQAKLPDALWGKPVSGLRLGLVPRDVGPNSDWDNLPADASLPTSITATPGEPLHSLLIVENVSDHEIKLSGYFDGEEMARSIEILDRHGKPVKIDSLHTDIPHFINHSRLKPGERMLLMMPAVYFRPATPDVSHMGLGYHVTAPDGQYSLRCTFRFGDLDNERHRHVPGKSEWIGKLTTGTQTIIVGDGKDADATANAAATTPPDGLDFLKPYPKLHRLSLDMTEPQFLEIVTKQGMKTLKLVNGVKVTHHFALGDGHMLIVKFGKDAKCSGIQRVRGEDAALVPPEIVRFANKGRSAVSVQVEDDLRFMLYSHEFLQTGLSKTVLDTGEWRIEGHVNLLKDGREVRRFAVKYTSQEPHTLYLDGKPFVMDRLPKPDNTDGCRDPGRLFFLRGEGETVQTGCTSALKDESDLDPERKWSLAYYVERNLIEEEANRINRKLFEIDGWVIASDSQHPTQHGSGTREAHLRVFPDGRVVMAAKDGRGLVESRVPRDEVAAFVNWAIDHGEAGPRKASAVVLYRGKVVPIFVDPLPPSLWDQHGSRIAINRDGKTYDLLSIEPSRPEREDPAILRNTAGALTAEAKDRLQKLLALAVPVGEAPAKEPVDPQAQKTTQALPEGLEFLKPYPKLHGLSLDMTEPQFLEIVKRQELKTRKTVDGEKVTHHIALGDDHTLIVMFDKDRKCSGIQRVRGEDAVDETISLAEAVRDFNAENKRLGRGLDQPALTEEEVITVIKRDKWQRGDPWSLNEKEIAAFKAVVESKRLPKGSRLDVHTEVRAETFLLKQVWQVRLMLPAIGHDGLVGLTIRNTKIADEKINPKLVAWGKPDAEGLALGAYLSPRKAQYTLGERVRLRLFVRNDGQQPVKGLTFSRTSHPMPDDFTVTDDKGAKVVVRIGHEDWDLPWVSGATGGRLAPGEALAFFVPYEILIGGDGSQNELIGRVIDAKPGQKLQLKVRAHNGNDRERQQGEPEPESGSISFTVAEGPLDPTAGLPNSDDATKTTSDAKGDLRSGNAVGSRDPRQAQGELRTLLKPTVLLPDHWIVQAVGFDNGGKELVTASNQSFITIRRWDVVGMKLISEIKLQGDKHGRAVRAGKLKFSGDRRRVIAATDEYVGIWDATTGKLLKQLPFKTKEGIYDCAIDKLDCTPDLSVIVGHRALPGRMTLSYDAHVIVWDGVSGNVLQTVIDKGATDLKAIDLSTDGKRLVTTNGSGAKIWETSTGKLLRSFPNDNKGRKHSDPEVTGNYNDHVWSVQLSPDGKQLAVGDILGVRLWDVASGKLVQQLEGPYRYSSGSNRNLVFSKDGQQLARLGTKDKTDGNKATYVVPIWSTQTGLKRFELHTESNDAVFSDDGQRLAVGFSDMQQALSVWPLSGDAANVEQTAGPGPHSRQDRVEENGHHVGKTAAEFIDKFQPTWGETKLGLQYGIALTKPQRQFRSGERVPLVVFFRNTSDKPIKFDTAPDFFGNTPKVFNAKRGLVSVENIPLLGHIPHYHETLAPGEALGPFYLNFGLGENPRPGQQHWHPYLKTPVAGQYKLRHSASINVAGPKDGEPSKRDDIATGTIEFEIVAGGQPATDDQANHPPTATRANQTISLADAIRDFNAENKQLGRGLDQPALTEDEVIAVIKHDQWKPEIARPKPQKHLTWAWKVIKRDQWKSDIAPLNETEIAAFKAVAESKRLPKDSYLQVHTEERPETFLFRQSWQVRLMLPAIGHDGFVGLTIRDTKLTEEKIDPQHVAWGKPDADGLSLGAYLSPKKDQYVLGERVRLRLFVRNDGQQPVTTTWANTTHPMPEDFTVSDETGAKVAIRIGHESWNLPRISGYVSGGLAPGNVHAFFVPYEISLGVNGSKNKLIGRVIDARPGQTLQLKVRSHNGNDRKRADGEPEPESGNVSFTVADDAKVSAAVDEKVGSGLTPGHFGGANQVMRIGPDGSISYSAGQGLCQMTLFNDDRLKIAFQNELQIWTDVTLPLVASPGPQRRTAWSAEIEGHTYHATAIPFSTKGCLFRLEKRLNGKLIHGSQQFFAVETKVSKDKSIAERDPPAVAAIKLREWRVDQSGTGVIAGQYTGAKQVMQIADDGTVSYSDHPQGICHLAVLEDDRLTATFLDKSGNPQDVMLPLVSNANGRAKWSAEVDSHTLRATASPYSDNVYIFRLEKLLNGKLIEGSQEFYAIQQKLRKATPEELEAVSKL